MAYWQAKYKDRLADPTIMVRNTEDSWTTDPLAVEAFQIELDKMLEWQEEQLVSPDPKYMEQILQSRRQAAERMQLLHGDGQFLAIDESLVYEMTPDECFVLSLLAAESAKSLNLESIPTFSDLPTRTDYFTLPPEATLAAYAPDADEVTVRRFQSEYRGLVTQYVAARGRVATISSLSNEAAIGLGLLPPHELWLERVSSEAQELQQEIAALRAMVRDLYLEVIRGA